MQVEGVSLIDVSPKLLAALNERGREFPGIERPKGYRRQLRERDCFRNASLIAWRDPRVTYVEGIALDVSLGVAFHHAWVTLDGVHAVDQTWRKIAECYFGIAVPHQELCETLARTGYYGSVVENLPAPDGPRPVPAEGHGRVMKQRRQ